MPRWPTAPFSTHRTGCYGCKRMTPSDGGCGVHGYPCTHWGVDTFTGGSRAVVAPEDATVVAVSDGGSPPFSGYGPGVVLLKGKSGYYHLLSHLELGSIKVMPGMQISEGSSIGFFDAGHGHCHYEVRRKPTGRSETNTIDPAVWQRSIGSSRVGILLVLGGLVAAGYLISRFGVSETR